MRRTEKLKCHRCRSTDHMAAKCAHKDKCCHKCHKIGHLARVCKTKQGLRPGTLMCWKPTVEVVDLGMRVTS